MTRDCVETIAIGQPKMEYMEWHNRFL